MKQRNQIKERNQMKQRNRMKQIKSNETKTNK